MSENKFTDTLNQLLDQLETVKTEIEKQNARMKQMEASNAGLLEALEDIEKELHLAGLDQRENNAHDVSSLPAKLCIRLHDEIQKARGLK